MDTCNESSPMGSHGMQHMLTSTISIQTGTDAADAITRMYTPLWQLVFGFLGELADMHHIRCVHPLWRTSLDSHPHMHVSVRNTSWSVILHHLSDSCFRMHITSVLAPQQNVDMDQI